MLIIPAAAAQRHARTPEQMAVGASLLGLLSVCAGLAMSLSLIHKMCIRDSYFTYRKIVWTHEVSGTSGSDDWRTPISA